MEAGDLAKAERFLDKSMKFDSSSKAQNLLYKLDTLKRRDAEGATSASSSPSGSKSKAAPPPEPVTIKKPTYT